MSTETIQKRIIRWNKDRNIPKVFDSEKEYKMILSELKELEFAETISDEVDAFCDIMVFATGALWKLGYDPDKAMVETLKEIESRGGSFNTKTGKWQKEITGKEYKADFMKCTLEED